MAIFGDLDKTIIQGIHERHNIDKVLHFIGKPELIGRYNHLWVTLQTNGTDYSCVWGQCPVAIDDASEVELIYEN